MTTNQDRAAEVIEGYYPPCQTCRARATVGIPEVGECDECAKECQYIAQALADAGLLTPDLPEPMSEQEAERTGAYSSKRWKAYTTDGRGEYEETVYVDAYENEIYPCNSGDDLLDPEAARAFAHALLAAAAYATQEKK